MNSLQLFSIIQIEFFEYLQRSLPDKLHRSRSAPARIAPRSKQFFRLESFKQDTRRFTPVMFDPSKQAFFILTPSRLLRPPDGSSKLQPINEADSKFAQSPLTPNN